MARGGQTDTAKTNWYVDLVMALFFLIVLAPTFTGLPLHEWLGLAGGAIIIVHLLLHWQWIVTTTQRFFGQVNALARLNYVINGILLITLIVVILSGLMISETVLKFFGLTASGGSSWRGIHSTSTNIILILFGVHVAMHWKWVTHAVVQYVFTPLRRPHS